MSRQLINRSDDLSRLVAEGFDLEIRSSHLLVQNVPYSNSKAEVQYGTLKDLINGRGASSLRTIPRVLEAPC